LSRLAEEIILWASQPFGFVKLPDAWSTGSSIMPNKRNPDAAELVRGKTGRINGNLVGLLTVVKGLALTYAKDLQEDKEGVFDSAENLTLCLAASAAMVRDMQPNIARMAAAAGDGFSTATDLADWLVRELKLPFRDAHHVTGKLVAKAESMGVDLSGLTIAEMREVEPRINDSVFGVLTPSASVASRRSYGGTAPDNVRAMVAEWQERLA
jgi:argininosuccinate lyase